MAVYHQLMMKHYILNAIVVIGVMIGLLGLGNTAVFSQDMVLPTDDILITPSGMPSPDTTREITNITTSEVKGEVVRIGQGKITLRTDAGATEIMVPGGVSVRRNGLDATLNEIAPGDTVTVERTPDGRVLSVEATAGGVGETAKVAVPVIIGLLLVGGIIWYMIRQNSKPHIKTTVE